MGRGNIVYGKPPLFEAYKVYQDIKTKERTFEAVCILTKAGYYGATKNKTFWIDLYYWKWGWK
jgi:hypothetical protein